MAKMEQGEGNSLYPIAVLIDELRNDDVQVGRWFGVYRAVGEGNRARIPP